MSDAFKALSHPMRREMLKNLREGPVLSGDFAQMFDVSWPTVSTHLKALKDAGLVTAERDGTSIIYRLNASVLEEVALSLFDLIGKEANDVETNIKDKGEKS